MDITSVLVGLLWLWLEACDGSSLMCNYCYHADLREDCLLNVLHCHDGHVCSVETSVVTYVNQFGQERTYNVYRMGCEHHSLCRDRVASGPGQLGYHVTSKICCCDHLCEEPDGVGQLGEGRLEKCPFLWENYTAMDSAATSARHTLGGSVLIPLVALATWGVSIA